MFSAIPGGTRYNGVITILTGSRETLKSRYGWGGLSVGILSSAALLAWVTPAAMAQSMQDTPGLQQTNPGLVTPRPDEDLKPGTRRETTPTPPPDEVELEVPKPPSATDDVQTIQFEVQKVELDGNTVFSDAQLATLVAPYEHRQVTLRELSELADKIADRYRSEGYPTTQVFLPPQRIQEGTVHIAIVEGKIGKVTLEGNKHYRTSVIANQLDFKTGELLKVSDLSDNLNNINRNQSYRLKAVITKGEGAGNTDINLQVEETQPWQIIASFDNQGRPLIGLYRYGLEIQNESLLGYGDKLNLRWLGASGTQVAVGSYNFPLHKSGTTLGYAYSFGYVDVDLERRTQPRIQGYAHNHSMVLTQPLNKSRTLTADVSANFREISTEIDHNELSHDRIRSLSGGVSFNRYDNWGRTFARLQSDVGISWLGGDRKFWKNSAYFTRLQSLPKRNLVILRASGQMSPDSLPSAEQYQVGGAYSVRGFTEGLLVGDRGYNIGAEWRWPIPGLRKISPDMADRFQGVFFYDLGQVWTDTSNPNFRGSNFSSSNRSLLMGAGFGLRARLSHYLSGFIDAGFGFPNKFRVEPNGQPDIRVHFGIQSELLPKEFAVRGTEKTVIKQ